MALEINQLEENLHFYKRTTDLLESISKSVCVTKTRLQRNSMFRVLRGEREGVKPTTS